MEQQAEKKKRVLSLIQPTGIPTLGNYLGALKNWSMLQGGYDTAFAVADLHSITVRQEPAKLRQQSLQAFALLMAIGLDPDKNMLFIQSHIDTHAQLAWILNCYTQFGELSRMTQFKEKSASHSDNVNAGLFTYPALMAADILLYQADFVPVGADQKQHLEITRNIAERFNGIYGNVFTVPEPLISKTCAKVMSLQEPEKKMSKSDTNTNSFILMLDSPDTIMRTVKRAVTDSESCVRYDINKPGVNNLMSIYSAVTGLDYQTIEDEFAGKGYGIFKQTVAEAVIAELEPVQNKYNELMKDKAYLEECYRKGAEMAKLVSSRTLSKVMKKVGFILP